MLDNNSPEKSSSPAPTFWTLLPPHFLCLAPMEGVTDVVFRSVVKQAAAPDVFFTEFTNVSSFASEKGRANAIERLDIAGKTSLITESQENSHPPYLVAQIWGKNPAHFKETAAALKEHGFDGLDINMGCPDRHVNKAGGGAAMINTPELAIECIKMAKSATTLPVSVKTRLGYSFIHEYKNWLPLLLNEHPAALTVHLRTRKEMSKVPAHFELIPEIIKLKNQISPQTKLIINGDISDKNAAKSLAKKYPEVDGFMIGRGIFQNPFCFSEYQPSREELQELFLYHLDLFDKRAAELSARGSHYPYEPLKHFFKIYISGFDGSKELRSKLMECKSTKELRAILSTI
ncbi:tRNA-dihydrouridine synthase [Candidatus Saccharibacteria bacterium]|nr:tRNA-dihydrouridine synthase [Candidatus Saccharibacteria bacterium]